MSRHQQELRTEGVPRTRRDGLFFLALGALSGLLLAAAVEAQTPQLDWIRQFGSDGDDTVTALDTDADGSIYIFGDSAGVLPGQVALGGRDVFLRKYDALGTELWTRQFGTPANDRSAWGLLADGHGHVYVVGWTEGVLPGQVGGGIPGGRDAFLSKYDEDGNEVWTRQFEAVGNDLGFDVALDAEGNPLVAGYTAFALPGQIWLGSTDGFVRKYDPEGNEIWTRQFGSSAGDFAVAVAGAADGAIYVGGETDGALPGQISSGSRDAFLRKYDGAGNELWTRQFGPSSLANGFDVEVDPFGGVFLGSSTNGTLPGQISGGGVDAFVRKYDADGSELWTRQFGASSADLLYALDVDSFGAVYCGGRGILPGEPWFGGVDAFARKYDAAGSEVWTVQFGTSEFDEAIGMALSRRGLALAGRTAGVFPGQIQVGSLDGFVYTLILDADGDGVLDDDDVCADTVIPESVPTVELKPNRWALTDADFDFDTVFKGKGKVPDRSYTTTDTAGCSCEQIIAVQWLGAGQTKHGCSISVMDDWVAFVNSL